MPSFAEPCSRHRCTTAATKRLTLLRPDGKPSAANVYCDPHCEELQKNLIPSYPGDRPAFAVEAIA